MKRWNGDDHTPRLCFYWNKPINTSVDMWKKYGDNFPDGEYCPQCGGFFTNHIAEDHDEWSHLGEHEKGRLPYCSNNNCGACKK